MHESARKIIVVEDNADLRYALALVLANAGYDVTPLSDGHAIVEENLELPDLFILDVGLPTGDGWTLCKQLRSKDKTKSIPIVMMSAGKTAKQMKGCRANDFIEKPFSIKEFLQRVERQLAGQPVTASE